MPQKPLYFVLLVRNPDTLRWEPEFGTDNFQDINYETFDLLNHGTCPCCIQVVGTDGSQAGTDAAVSLANASLDN